MRKWRLREARLPAAICFLLGLTCGFLIAGAVHTGWGGSSETVSDKEPEERVQYFGRILLHKGWQPVGYDPVQEDEGRESLNVYAFVYHGDKLEAVYKGDGKQVVYTNALVLGSEVSPYGAGPFVVSLADGQPRIARSFTTTNAVPEYHARFDEEGNLAEYIARREIPGGLETSAFRCTYNERGLLAERQRIGEDEVNIHLNERKARFYYSENGRKVLRVAYYEHATVARLLEFNARGQVFRTTFAERLPDGRYRVMTATPAAPGEWEYTDEMPTAFRDYVEEIPVPEEKLE